MFPQGPEVLPALGVAPDLRTVEKEILMAFSMTSSGFELDCIRMASVYGSLKWYSTSILYLSPKGCVLTFAD